jgi:magnesium chelatase family protein
MGLATVYSRAQIGIEAPEVHVEVNLAGGLPMFSLVGLPDTEVKESKDRVRAAIGNSGYRFPSRRITVNLAPAGLPKEGGRFDLAIALGILAAGGQIPAERLTGYEFLGELSLSGELRPVRGALPAAIQAARAGRTLVLPEANAGEAALAGEDIARGAGHLAQVSAALAGRDELTAAMPPVRNGTADVPDLSDVRGQHRAKRALEIAAAGGHSLLMLGPPGSGKTMLATRLPGILPPLTGGEALSAAAVASVTGGGFDPAEWGRRPFRAPHHTASGVALVGGGAGPRPGEITLAHHGVLFLDELPEFNRSVLEVLREPLESGRITISRAARQADFPACFQLVAAMNPCPCGYLGDTSGRCHCSAEQVARYRRRLSGPLLDRIDMHLYVSRPPREALTHADPAPAENSAAVRERVAAARVRAAARGHGPVARLRPHELRRVAEPDEGGRRLLDEALDRLELSARAYHRILKLARTIADLEGAARPAAAHVSEAVSYRILDRPAPD